MRFFVLFLPSACLAIMHSLGNVFLMSSDSLRLTCLIGEREKCPARNND